MTAKKPVENTGSRFGVRRRILHWSLFVIVISLFGLPLIGYVFTDQSVVNAAVEEQTNPRANYWREVREGTAGYTAIVGQETNVLVQNGGQNWRQVRNGIVTSVGAGILAIVVLALGLYHIILGPVKLENPSGIMVMRWSMFERVMHWFVAILFIILAITGLSLLYGRAVLIPLLGREGFAVWAELAKDSHNYLALLFVAGLAVMLLAWIRENLPTRHDWTWLRQAGGLFNRDIHPHAGRVNAGEKIWFWMLFFAGIAVCVSGFYMLFPNLAWERDTMQLANIIHAGLALLLVALSLGHIYLGTIGEEGAFKGMITGKIDKELASQHYDLWYQEVAGQVETKQPPSGTAQVAPPPESST